QTCAVVMLDIDHFKAVNDGFGHETGDQVLMAIGGILRGQFREGDAVARYGGEEFVACVASAKSSELVGLCERIRQAVGSHDWTRLASGLRVTVSVGASIHGDEPASLDALISRADIALYQAKNQGRDRVVLYNQGP
ncbi:MAG: GGDEF domain-containing protein, partial [Spirochaetales bacterium]